MKPIRAGDNLIGLLHELRKFPSETEWVEFKRDNADPEEIGEYISALSNAAVLAGRAAGYLVWGVEDSSHQIVGTKFAPHAARVGNEQLENWLGRLLDPGLHFVFAEISVEAGKVVLLEVPRAPGRPYGSRGRNSSVSVRTRRNSGIIRRRNASYGASSITHRSRITSQPRTSAMTTSYDCWTIRRTSTS